MKKLLCVLLSAVLLTSSAVATSAATSSSVVSATPDKAETQPTEGYCDGFYYNVLDDGTAEITEYDGDETDLVIPEKLDKISVSSIGRGAFYKNEDLEAITIPNSVTNIGNEAFIYCDNLKEISVDNNNNNYISINGCLFDKKINTLIHYPAAKKDTKFIIPEGVKEIEDYAFYNCKCLQEIEMPNSIEDILPLAFCKCTGLQKINLPEGLVRIDYMAFAHCSSLREIKIPGTLEYFGGHGHTFGGCTSLEKVEFEDGLEYIGAYAFDSCNNLNTLIVPNSLKCIQIGAFSRCINLSNVYYNGSINDWTKIDGLFWFSQLSTKAEKEINIHYNLEKRYLLGDVNSDDEVNITDATEIQRYLAGYEVTLSEDEQIAADTNGDGVISISDATEIQKFIAELPSAIKKS